MTERFIEGGIVMWPLLLVAVGVLVLVARTAVKVFDSADRVPEEIEGGLHTILFWGAFSAVLGLLGTTIGITQMAQAIMLAGAVEPMLVWGGVAVALPPVIFGLLILLVAAFCWLLLRQQLLRRRGGRARPGLAA